MGSHWPLMLGCLCALIAIGHSAAVSSNKEALVVAKPNNANPETIEEAVQQSTTEAPVPPVKVVELEVKSAVSLRYSRTAIASLVKNPASKSQQYTFSFIMPDTAFITGFSMTIDGQTYKAYVKEKEEAKQIYNDAVSQGLSAAHVATKARDSNHFTVSVNMKSKSSVLFNLTYEELLTRYNSLYKISITLNPGMPVPRFSVEVHIKEFQKINKLRVPEIGTGNEIIPDNDAQNTKAVITRAADDREAKIKFTPDIDLQKKLMDIYAQKSKESEANAHRQFYLDGDDESKPEGILGQFLIQYDVESELGSDVMVNDGYFVHFFAPRSLPPLPKYVTFVLDTSGSMSGTKIMQLREAMKTILGQLYPHDYFAIIEFASAVKVHNLEETEKPAPTKPTHYVFYEREQSPKLIPPYKATPENIAKAKTIVDRLTAVGGTNIAAALNTALELVQRGLNWKPETINETVTEPVTETEITTTEAAQNDKSSKAIKLNPKQENDIEKEANSHEPIIMFLTDGEATVGETNPKRIASNVYEKNVGPMSSLIFSLAFGNGADRNLLRKISVASKALMIQVYEAADAALQLQNFYRSIASPTLANVTFTYPPDQVKKTTKTKYRTFFDGMEMIVAGKVDKSTKELTSEVSGFCGVEDGLGRKRYEVRSKGIVPKKDKDNEEYLPLERLWAYLTIKQLLDESEVAEQQDKPKEEKEKFKNEALEIALKYAFVTEVTSLVVVKPNETDTVNAERADGNPSSANYLSGASQLSAANFAPSAFKADLSSAIGQAQWDSSPSQQQFMPEFLFESEDDIDDADYDGLVPSSAIADHHPTPLQPIQPPNTLATFHVEDYTWTKSLLDLNTGELKLQDNGVSTILKLTKDANAPQSLSPCSRSTNGAPGDCMYLTLCKAAQNITADQYLTTYCKIDSEYAGVCCPKASDSQIETENEPSESDCDEESNGQLDKIDGTSDDGQTQNDETTNVDTNSNDDTGLSNAQNVGSEILNDKAELPPQDDTSIDDNIDSNDESAVPSNPGAVDGTESVDDDPVANSDENVTPCNDNLDNQEHIINDDDS